MTRLPTLLFTAAGVLAVSGCMEAGSGDAGSIGKSIGKNVTEFAQGVGTGVDSQLQIKIELSDALTESGLSATVAKQQTPLNGPEKSVTVYFIATKELSAKLIAKAYNSEDLEIGRAAADASFAADDARYISFVFPPEMDRQMVAYYRIDARQEAPIGK